MTTAQDLERRFGPPSAYRKRTMRWGEVHGRWLAKVCGWFAGNYFRAFGCGFRRGRSRWPL